MEAADEGNRHSTAQNQVMSYIIAPMLGAYVQADYKLCCTAQAAPASQTAHMLRQARLRVAAVTMTPNSNETMAAEQPNLL